MDVNGSDWVSNYINPYMSCMNVFYYKTYLVDLITAMVYVGLEGITYLVLICDVCY